MIDEQAFRNYADKALEDLQRKLEGAAEEYEFDVDRKEGALTVEFEDPPARFVVSPNAPVRQIWVSALVQSFKLDWDGERDAFTYNNGPVLSELMADVITKQLGRTVNFR